MYKNQGKFDELKQTTFLTIRSFCIAVYIFDLFLVLNTNTLKLFGYLRLTEELKTY